MKSVKGWGSRQQLWIIVMTITATTTTMTTTTTAIKENPLKVVKMQANNKKKREHYLKVPSRKEKDLSRKQNLLALRKGAYVGKIFSESNLKFFLFFRSSFINYKIILMATMISYLYYKYINVEWQKGMIYERLNRF